MKLNISIKFDNHQIHRLDQDQLFEEIITVIRGIINNYKEKPYSSSPDFVIEVEEHYD